MSKSVSLSSPNRLPRQLLALVFASGLLGGSALAQTRAAAPTAGAQVVKRDGTSTVTYKQRTNYDFDDDQVEGTLVQPDTDLITGRLKASHESLVRPRTTFQPEMLKSVESL
jgi:hypothetical protein